MYIFVDVHTLRCEAIMQVLCIHIYGSYRRLFLYKFPPTTEKIVVPPSVIHFVKWSLSVFSHY